MSFFAARAGRRAGKALFPPGPCMHCDSEVHVKGDHWVHEDGTRYAKLPRLDYDMTPDLPRHTATPGDR